VSDFVGAAKLSGSSNVFYLPAAVSVPEAPPAPSRWASLTRTWWRVRFAVAGIRLAFKPAPTPLFTEDETLAILQGEAEVVERRQRPTRPARVIDFDAARSRLRPVAATQ
jgi:hypothetical protein